ncbi:MAG: sulfurtransferase TusA family protein [Candidatus Omnitrophica bacterium]|nr:sulfurtransferase TusA family protein [Candidatus Omnitrophota bacterium]
MFKLPKKIIDDMQNYEENLKKFLSGKINDTFFRGVRVPWGYYAQRGGKILMSRLRIPAGILTPEQLKAIAIAAKNFADERLHITTRQDIQIHNVPYENSIKIIEYLKDFNLSPRAGGGNTVRNITACYLSGICPEEKIEVYKTVWGLTEYLLTLDESYNLPRKFKIAFSGCVRDCAYAGVNDVGFIAGVDGFKVLCGGGMGAKSSVGKVLIDEAEPENVAYIVKSILNVFNKFGDRKNKHHNRLRFLIQDIGWEKFFELYNQEFNKLKDTEYISLRNNTGLPKLENRTRGEIKFSDDESYNLFLKYNVAEQKQKGYYYVHLRIPLGEINSEQLIRLSELVEIVPEIIFRTTQRQNLVISNVPSHKLYFVYEKVKDALKDFLFPDTIFDMISCKAVTTCNLGICNAMGLVPEIIKRLEKINLDIDKLKDIRVNVSGCPNSCGHHRIGTISFSGLTRKVYNRSVPFYKIYLGGKINAENTRLAEEIGIVPAHNIPDLFCEFIFILQSESEGDVHKYILNEGKIHMLELIKKYSYVPSYEENKAYYKDFGMTEEFSLDGLSQGECGAGVIDMVESDIESAKQLLISAKEKNLEINDIKDALVYSARALLVVKGIDPRSEEEAISGFIDKFIKTGICNPEFENLNSIYAGIISDKVSRQQAYEYTWNFYQEVKRIYSSMDSNFNFLASFKEPTKTNENQPDQPRTLTYDLTGTPCPINYVKIKLKLEELNIGDILEVFLDDGEPIRNVPKSLKNDGQEIIKIEQVKDFFKVLIKRKV